MFFDLDVAIFVGFLLMNLGLGLMFSRGVRTMTSYAIGDGKFSTAVIVSTIVATWVSGEFFVTIITESYNAGLMVMSIVILGNFLGLFLIGLFFTPRMAEFLGKLSIAEAMGDLYGKKVRAITALAGFVGVSGIIAVQLKIAGTLFEYALGVPITYGIILSGIAITLYSSLGGIKSVSFTDVIQFFMFGVMIPTVAYFLFGQIPDNQMIIDTINNNPLFDVSAVFSFSNPQIYYWISVFLWICIPEFNPAIFQRVAMARDVGQAKMSFVIASFLVPFLGAIICWIGILMLTIYPDIDGNDILKLFVTEYNWVMGFKGLLLAGIMAMVMSTVDSYINSTSVLVMHDLREALDIKLRRGSMLAQMLAKLKLDIKNTESELFATRICSMVIGLVSIVFAMRGGSFLELFIWASMCYMPIVTIPFMMSIFGFRSSSSSVLAGMISGFTAVVVWEFFFKDSFYGIAGLVPGMLANLIGLFAYHYLFKQPGGWVGIKNQEQFTEHKAQKNRQWKLFWRNMTLANFFDSLKKNMPQNEGMMSLFGLFITVSTLFSIYSIPKELQLQYKPLFDFLYPVTLCSATMLIAHPLWSLRITEKAFIAVYWHAVLFFVLICFSFLAVLISDFSEVQLMVFMINILMLSSLISWRYSLSYLVFGIFITLLFYKHYLEQHQIQYETLSIEFKVAYMLLLVVGTLTMFLKPKQDHNELTEATVDYQKDKLDVQKEELSKAYELKNEFLRNLQHEARTPITGITSLGEALYASYDMLNDEQRKSYLKDISDSSTRLNSYVNNLIDLSKLSSMNYSLNKEPVNLGDLIHSRADICQKLYTNLKDKNKRNVSLIIEDDVITVVDKYYITQTIDNIIINAIQYCKEGNITISLKENKKAIEFSVCDEGIGVPEEDLDSIFGAFVVSSTTRTPAGGRGVGLALCKKIIELHGGTIEAKQNQGPGITVTFELPR